MKESRNVRENIQYHLRFSVRSKGVPTHPTPTQKKKPNVFPNDNHNFLLHYVFCKTVVSRCSDSVDCCSKRAQERLQQHVVYLHLTESRVCVRHVCSNCSLMSLWDSGPIIHSKQG
ncbi:hypothetical protein ILYODFUR_004898 [Ilyodon furcidens]|uniref:Uncharacterized protein n=1 Tax=Ilyodon furcidens TaxID=33524 RepID=A0ABV0TH88_9TELE